ncbi:MAG: GNAT family N-acetyltransferase [Clostridia bacterium]|nr:GNAT family N-acetyltransferase [Clostridia bacterium]
MIRKFQPEDLPQVMNIWLEENIKAHNFINSQHWEENYAFVQGIIPQAEVYVILNENIVAGFIGIDNGFIAGLFVKEAFQGKGLGRKLIEKAKSEYTRLSLHVYKKNAQAIEFYKRLGFFAESERIEEANGEEEYVMVWEKNKLVILEEPFVSSETIEYLKNENVKVLKNNKTEEIIDSSGIQFVSEAEFLSLYNQQGIIYTNSENALSWIINNIDDKELLATIDNVKDKNKFREILKPLDPDFFYKEVSLENLENINPGELPLPLILKPSVGFFSVGVYTIESSEDWDKAVKEIKAQHKEWKNTYAESVVSDGMFILEQYITGYEYAIDAYFDNKGNPVILNIMKHEFSGSKDVSDRLYYSGYQVIKHNLENFTNYLNEINKYLKAKNFPVHIEIRVEKGKIMAIECNPMRFAGWCTTDLTLFAYGFRTYDYYLNNIVPDWDSLLKGKEDILYGMVVLDKSGEINENTSFDYEGIEKCFDKVLKIRKLDYKKYPVFGFVFTETKVNNKGELDRMMTEDLKKYLR